MRKFIFPLVVILLLIITIRTNASQDITINRLAGYDRYESAYQIAKAGWIQADNAIVAYGENYPDALAAVPLAKKLNAPILLTNNDTLNPKTITALQELKVRTVYLVGGTSVISKTEESTLTDAGYTVKRLAGQDRYETAIKIAEEMGDVKRIAITSGDDYADALSIGPIAAEMQMPIILVPKDNIPTSIQNYLNTIEIFSTYVVGGQDIISDNVVSKFENPERITGQDKYDRNIAVLNYFNYIYYDHKICLATGENFADALAGGMYAAKNNGAVALVKTELPAPTEEFLRGSLASSSNFTVFGGESVVPSSLTQSISNSIKTINVITNTNDISNMGIEIIQDNKSYKISNQIQEINIGKSPFSIQFNLNKKADIAIASIGDFNLWDKVITNTPRKDVLCFSDGTGYAAYGDRAYDTMYISNYGHHYIFYEDNESRRADLVESKENYNCLKWDINKVTFDSLYSKYDYDIKDAPINSLFLVLFTDKNLNNIIDSDEFAKLKVNLN